MFGKLLKKVDKWPSKKQYLFFLALILIPNLLRQIVYFISFLKTGYTDFIISGETIRIYGSGKFIFGALEEILIGIIFSLLWFKFDRLKFLSYGWISDAAFDFLSVLTYFIFGAPILSLLGLNNTWHFLLRELILFYIISGPILAKFRVNIKKLVVAYSVFGIIVLIVALLY